MAVPRSILRHRPQPARAYFEARARHLVFANRDSSLAKLGMTRTGTPDMCASQYEAAHGIAWRAFWQAPTANVAEVEARCHRELASRRVSSCPKHAKYFIASPPPRSASRCERQFLPIPTARLAASAMARDALLQARQYNLHSTSPSLTFRVNVQLVQSGHEKGALCHPCEGCGAAVAR
jgi:hypothetical protein